MVTLPFDRKSLMAEYLNRLSSLAGYKVTSH
jgi:hypothetical protein